MIMSNIWHDEITPVFIYNIKISDLVAVMVMAFLQSTMELQFGDKYENYPTLS